MESKDSEERKMTTIQWKFPNRRKEEEFVIYKPHNNKVVIQSDKTIAQIDLETKKGLLNAKGSNSKYFHDLIDIRGAIEYEFSNELVNQVIANMPKAGDVISEEYGITWA
jgi:hypothetical protein